MSLEAAELEHIVGSNSLSQNVVAEKLIKMWLRIISVDAQISPDTNVSDFADSLTLIRFRNRIKCELALDIVIEKLLDTGTLRAQATFLASSRPEISVTESLTMKRDGPPQTDDISITFGDPKIANDICS